MPPKKIEPVAGQKSLFNFFSAKPKVVAPPAPVDVADCEARIDASHAANPPQPTHQNPTSPAAEGKPNNNTVHGSVTAPQLQAPLNAGSTKQDQDDDETAVIVIKKAKRERRGATKPASNGKKNSRKHRAASETITMHSKGVNPKRKRAAVLVESDSDEDEDEDEDQEMDAASGSEYAVTDGSDASESDDDDESVVDADASEEEEDLEIYDQGATSSDEDMEVEDGSRARRKATTTKRKASGTIASRRLKKKSTAAAAAVAGNEIEDVVDAADGMVTPAIDKSSAGYTTSLKNLGHQSCYRQDHKACSTTPAAALTSSGMSITPSVDPSASAVAVATGHKARLSSLGPGVAGRSIAPPRPLTSRADRAGAGTDTRNPIPAPGAGSAAALRRALEKSPSLANAGPPSSNEGGGSPGDQAAKEAKGRFSARDGTLFSHLQPDRIRDAKQRRPSDPGYDPNTVYIPPNWFKQHKISEGQKQWWEFKAANWGSVLLFKMGKFYEMFEMDAHVGSEVLGLSYMRDERPHCGFPEVNYAQMAERLARAGHRVVVIEQTETPDMMAKRNEERKKAGLKKDMVVRREKVAVLTRGTLTDAEMVGCTPDATYIMAIAELPCVATHDAEYITTNAREEEGKHQQGGMNASLMINTKETHALEEDAGDVVHHAKSRAGRVYIGAAVADVAAGRLLVGQWTDDELRSGLRAVLTALQPAEVILPRGSLSKASRRIVLGVPKSPQIVDLTPNDDEGGFWSAEHVWHKLLGDDAGENYYHPSGKSLASEQGEGAVNAENSGLPAASAALPAVLAAMNANRGKHEAAATALGGCLSYLKSALLDRRLLGAGTVEALEDVVGVGFGAATSSNNQPVATVTNDTINVPAGAQYAALDGPALENLEILENSDGGIAGTLLAALDHCTTPFGRRRLRQWLCRPLARAEDIVARQDAVADLMGAAEEAAGSARKSLSGIADLERALSRLCASGSGYGPAREGPRVILYEDTSKKRVKGFVTALRALERVSEAASGFTNCGATSTLLLRLVTPGKGRFPDLRPALEEVRGAADWNAAEATGRVVPAPGVDAAYDAAESALAEAEAELDGYLKRIKRELGANNGNNEVRYASLNKESHVIEVAEHVKVPVSWEAMQGKKGVKRYINAELRELVVARVDALEAKEDAQTGILQSVLAKFAEQRDVWMAAVDATAELDALMSLAVAACCSASPMTRPVLRPWTPGERSIFKAQGLCHPAGISGAGGNAFVPNNVQLGGEDGAPFTVLTGPNMGGKSTLMRQVCLAAVAAQIGAWVPAASLELTPADALFVRMGARDRILLGQSTFFVELSETAAALARATPASIVALDELGRGTATTDGEAIATAVLDHLARKIGCRGVFATHYHRIAESHANDPCVSIKHMACAVTPATSPGDVDDVTFLYRLTEGACPKSYGVNVARLAGLPESVILRAAAVSESFERGTQQDGSGDGERGMEVAAPEGGRGNDDKADKASMCVRVSEMEIDALSRRVLEACRCVGSGGVGGICRVKELWSEVRAKVL